MILVNIFLYFLHFNYYYCSLTNNNTNSYTNTNLNNVLDIELWYALDNNARRSLLLNLVSLYREQEDLKTAVYQSRLIKFFVDFDSDEGSGVSVDAINALALINALLLTIPFGIMSLFSAEYVNDLYLAVESCPDGESKVFNHGVYVYVLNNLSACLYGCSSG